MQVLWLFYNRVKFFTRFLKLDSDSSGKLSLQELLSLPELRNNPLVKRVTGHSVLPKHLQKVRKSQQILIRDKIAYVRLKIFVRVQTFWRVPPVLPRNFCHPAAQRIH